MSDALSIGTLIVGLAALAGIFLKFNAVKKTIVEDVRNAIIAANQTQKTEITPQPIRVEMEEKFLKRESFKQYRIEHERKHEIHEAKISAMEQAVADQKARSEINGARLMQMDQKIDALPEKVSRLIKGK